jgi:hypothetical protein
MSSPIQPSGTSTPSSARMTGPSSWLHRASRRSFGSASRRPAAEASAARARSTSSRGQSEAPMLWPEAARMGNTCRLRLQTRSATWRRRRTRPISRALAPPMIATRGCPGDCTSALRAFTSRTIRRPAADGGRRATPNVTGFGEVGTAECIVDVDVRELRQRCREDGVVACLTVLEADVSRMSIWRARAAR